MPREKPFLVVLLTAVFVALGVLGILSAMLFLGIGLTEEMQTVVLLTAVLGIGYLVAGYGLYREARWGWLLATAFTVLSLVGNYLYASYLAVMIDATILVLLLLTAKHYGIPLFGKPSQPASASPVPPPSAPIAVAFAIPKEEKRFVKRKHR
ncbi:MAG: hypothetical protein DRJ60_00050 [Thermoprotei archaeon]|nr:MAG: hypothetical protein DRJ60_00050 [Thermoprotei archaeon]